jgi:acetylornithine deacetylase/succinyl-diaminopimelate desuccinylase-like protein
MRPVAHDRGEEVAELLQQLIRNKCVNDGSAQSGHELRNADVLRAVVERPSVDLQVYEPLPGRASLVARIEGRRPGAPSLAFLGHTDVVPANGDDWRHDPFGGELIDGEVWGRGAVDMLNLTASMAVAFGHLADEGFRPDGDLLFIGEADEEALGSHGAEWLTAHVPEVRTDYLITEAGGFPRDAPDGTRLPVITGEKGTFWCTMTVRGTPGHASQPLRTDNALVKAAAVVRRLAAYQPAADINDAWRRFVLGVGLPPEVADPLLDPERIDAFCDEFPELALAREAHACTHTTMTPTIMATGGKVNVIPDRVRLQVDIRTLPGWERPDVEAMLGDALGDLAGAVDVAWDCALPASSSPIDTPLWHALEKVARRSYPDARCVPYLTVGATDAPFFRQLGTVAYGFGLFSRRLTFADYTAMFHGVDERVDVASLGLSADLWDGLARSTLV